MFPIWNVLRHISWKFNFQLGSIFEIFVCSGFLELGISSFNMKTSRDGKLLPLRPYLLCIVGHKENLVRDQSCEMFLPQVFYATQTGE